MSVFELPVGTRFYFGDTLIEVVKVAERVHNCSSCVFYKIIFGDEYLACCNDIKCYHYERKDKKDVIFKEVKNV